MQKEPLPESRAQRLVDITEELDALSGPDGYQLPLKVGFALLLLGALLVSKDWVALVGMGIFCIVMGFAALLVARPARRRAVELRRELTELQDGSSNPRLTVDT
jgi:hypothetical protein